MYYFPQPEIHFQEPFLLLLLYCRQYTSQNCSTFSLRKPITLFGTPQFFLFLLVKLETFNQDKEICYQYCTFRTNKCLFTMSLQFHPYFSNKSSFRSLRSQNSSSSSFPLQRLKSKKWGASQCETRNMHRFVCVRKQFINLFLALTW